MKNLTYDHLDKAMSNKYFLSKRTDTGNTRRNYPFTVFSLLLIALSVYLVKNESFNYPLSENKTWWIIIFSYVLIIPLHELLHFIPAKLMGYNPKLHFFHNAITEPIKREDFIIFTLSPIIYISTLLIVLMFIFTSYIPLFLLLIGTHLISCSGDISQYTLIRKFNKHCYIVSANSKEYRGYM